MATQNVKSRLSFHAQGRKRRIFRLSPQGAYHVRFKFKSKRFTRSLGTTFPAVAIAKAKKLIDAVYGSDVATVQAMKVRSDFALLRAVGDRFIAKFGSDFTKRKTARNYVGCLEKIVRLGGAGSLDQARSDVLTDALVRRYEEEELKRVDRDAAGDMRHASELRVRTTIGSTLRQARAIFRPETLHWFDGMTLPPDLAKFRRQGVKAPNRPKPAPLDYGVIEALEADAPRLEREEPALYAAFLLFSLCGLRNSEIEHARVGWLRRRQDGVHEIGIIVRPEEEFDPKGNEGWVPMPAQVYEALRRIAGDDPDAYLIPAATRTERHEIVNRRICEWAGRWIRNRTKVIYELRRYAGSRYYDQMGDIVLVQQFLRHADLATTMKWYWYRLKPLAALATPGFMARPALRVVA